MKTILNLFHFKCAGCFVVVVLRKKKKETPLIFALTRFSNDFFFNMGILSVGKNILRAEEVRGRSISQEMSTILKEETSPLINMPGPGRSPAWANR